MSALKSVQVTVRVASGQPGRGLSGGCGAEQSCHRLASPWGRAGKGREGQGRACTLEGALGSARTEEPRSSGDSGDSGGGNSTVAEDRADSVPRWGGSAPLSLGRGPLFSSLLGRCLFTTVAFYSPFQFY